MKAKILGIGSAVAASLCCLGPAMLAAVGLGGLGLAVVFIRHSGWFVLAAVVLLLVAWGSYWREATRCRQLACQMRGRWLTLAILIPASLIVGYFVWMHI